MEAKNSSSIKRHIPLIGQSEAMKRVRDRIEKVAESDSTILLFGESGTGKEVVAKAIHYQGPRSDRSFIPVNCGAIPEALLESELFGHEKGAFTGANNVRQGRFELADGGTLFLDEIGEMPYPLQVKILRVLQEREFERIGGSKSLHVDVRIIAATNIDLEQAVLEKKFRKDLFYRLNVIPITLPALRERKDDIPLFISHFLDQFSEKKQKTVGISQEAAAWLGAYSWPGNIREVENMMERMVILAEGETITVDDLPQKIRESVAVPANKPCPSAAPYGETDKPLAGVAPLAGVVPLPFWAAGDSNLPSSAASLPLGEEGERGEVGEGFTPADYEKSPAIGPWSGTLSDEGVNFTQLVEAFENQLIQEALKKAKGVKSKAAQLLHLNRTTLVEKLKRKNTEHLFSEKEGRAPPHLSDSSTGAS